MADFTLLSLFLHTSRRSTKEYICLDMFSFRLRASASSVDLRSFSGPLANSIELVPSPTATKTSNMCSLFPIAMACCEKLCCYKFFAAEVFYLSFLRIRNYRDLHLKQVEETCHSISFSPSSAGAAISSLCFHFNAIDSMSSFSNQRVL